MIEIVSEGVPKEGGGERSETQWSCVKYDYIVFQEMTEIQRARYQAVLRRLELRDSSLLGNISSLLSLCRHPVLTLPLDLQTWRNDWAELRCAPFSRALPSRSVSAKPKPRKQPTTSTTKNGSRDNSSRDNSSRDSSFSSEGEEDDLDEDAPKADEIDQSSREAMREASAKFSALYKLLIRLIEQGHKVLIFSKSTQTLDLIEYSVLFDLEEQLGFCHRRIDGTIDSRDREEAVTAFNVGREGGAGDDLRVMLLTTKSGGMGLNLAAADRVIVFDSNYNPALDNQAIDRAFRLGQKSDVVVYRFIFGGGIEDGMLRIQSAKMDLSSVVLSYKKNARINGHLTQSEIGYLYKLTTVHDSALFKRLEKLQKAATAINVENNGCKILYECDFAGDADLARSTLAAEGIL